MHQKSPIIVSGGGMEHYGRALQKSFEPTGLGHMTHYHIPTDAKFPDGEMDSRCLPKGLYDDLHTRDIIPVISSQDAHSLESLRLLGYIKDEIRGAKLLTGTAIMPYDASARADKDEGRISGSREIPYSRVDSAFLATVGAKWRICIDHHNSGQAKGRDCKLKNIKSTFWEGVAIKKLLEELGIDQERVAKLDPDQSAGERTEQQMRVLHESLGFVPHRATTIKKRDDVTGETSIEDMRTSVRLEGGNERVPTELEGLKNAEMLVLGDDIISSGGTMIKAVKHGVRTSMFQSLKHIVFVAPHVLASSGSSPADYREKALASLSRFVREAEAKGTQLHVISGNTLANPIDNPNAMHDFSFTYADTSPLITEELSR